VKVQLMKGFMRFSASCERARADASRRLDGELSELEQEFLRAHLARCEACTVFVREIEGFTYALRTAELERPSIPVALPHRHRISLRGLQVASVAAVSALAVIGLGPTLIGSLTSVETPTVAAVSGAQPNPVTAGENILLRRVRLAQMQARTVRSEPQRGLGLVL
jgi:predicted anti-sigma-YlaC factor YlaD